MRDGTALLGAGIFFSLLAWTVWHYAGINALDAIVLLALIVVSVDNARLRRKLQERLRKEH